MNFSVLILLIAIILFGVLAFRQMSALILAPVVTIFVIVLSGMPILDTLLQHFMPATSDYITKYFLIFFVGALFGAVYQFTGAAESIARTMGCFCGNHFVAPMIMCITGLLTFGGVSGFVVFFVVYPIADVQACQSDTPPDSCGNFGRLLDMVHDSARLSLYSEHHRHEKLRHNCNGSLPPLPDCHRRRVPDDFRLAGMQSQKIYGAGQAL